jgi:hypothetical protein
MLCALIALVLAATAPGKAAVVLGAVGGKAPPSCPTPKAGSSGTDPKFCQAIASVTGFQMIGHSKRAAFKVPKDGRLVAWSIDISAPSPDEQNSFISTFKFGQPTARIAVLKPVSKSKFKLAKQSPKVDLTAELGSQPIFTLKSPLRVKKGSVIAISTANWIPNLAHDGALTADGDKWRASRSRKKCGTDPNKTPAENKADILASKPQKKVGTTRTYGCTYTASRLLYQAYYVPDGK